MAIHKRKRRGKIDWYFKCNAPGGTRESRRIIRGFGYQTRQAAIEAEANRRVEEQRKLVMSEAGATVVGAVPKTLAELFDEFFRVNATKLARKTVDRYQDFAKYLSPELLAMPISDITRCISIVNGRGCSNAAATLALRSPVPASPAQ
jgi:hypothetical protein